MGLPPAFIALELPARLPFFCFDGLPFLFAWASEVDRRIQNNEDLKCGMQ